MRRAGRSGARRVPLVIVDRHDRETLIPGPGVHGASTIRAAFAGDRFDATWNRLGRTSRIRGELQP